MLIEFQKLTKGYKFVALQESFNAHSHFVEVGIVSKSRAERDLESRLLRINFPGVKIHNHGLPVVFVNSSKCQVCVGKRQNSQVTSTPKRQI